LLRHGRQQLQRQWPRLSTTVAASPSSTATVASTSAPSASTPPPTSAAGAAPNAEEDASWLTWPARNPLTCLFFTVVGTWVYSLWVSNKANKLKDATEETIRGREPVNEDEVLDLRSFNEVESSAIATLPDKASAKRLSIPELLALLRRTVGGGAPLKDEYALERMLMSLPGAPDAVEVRVAAAAIAVISVGNTAERLEAIFHVLGERPAAMGAAPERLSSEALLQVLQALLLTGQVPAEKRVYVHDEGKNEIGLAKSWYQIPPIREWSADEWRDVLLRGQYVGAAANAPQGARPRPPPEAPPAEASTEGAESAAPATAAAAAPAPAALGTTPSAPAALPAGWQEFFEPASGKPYYVDSSGEGTWRRPVLACAPSMDATAAPPQRPESVDLAQFCEMLTSELVCVWGECYRVAERKRLAKQREEDEEYRRNPPWYARAWSAAKGMVGREAA